MEAKTPAPEVDTPKPLPYKQRMSLTQDALAGLPTHTNNPAEFQGRLGYWVQGEAVFIPTMNPATAIAFYRQRFNAADIAVSHNLATAAVGRMKAAAALDEFRQLVATELVGLLIPMNEPIVRDDVAWPSTKEEKEWASHNKRITALATRLGLDLSPPPPSS